MTNIICVEVIRNKENKSELLNIFKLSEDITLLGQHINCEIRINSNSLQDFNLLIIQQDSIIQVKSLAEDQTHKVIFQDINCEDELMPGKSYSKDLLKETFQLYVGEIKLKFYIDQHKYNIASDNQANNSQNIQEYNLDSIEFERILPNQQKMDQCVDTHQYSDLLKNPIKQQETEQRIKIQNNYSFQKDQEPSITKKRLIRHSISQEEYTITTSMCSLNSQEIIKLEKMGIKFVKSIEENSNILLMNKYARTVKFLVAMNKGISIVGTQWLFDCLTYKALLPPGQYILKSKEINIRECLLKSRNRKEPLFQSIKFGYKDWDSLGSEIKFSNLRQIIQSAGGSLYQNIKDCDIIIVKEESLIKRKKTTINHILNSVAHQIIELLVD